MSYQQPDPVLVAEHNRRVEATRAAELMLGSSATSSVNSLNSSVGSLGTEQRLQPDYGSQPPPSYGSYMQYQQPELRARASPRHMPGHQRSGSLSQPWLYPPPGPPPPHRGQQAQGQHPGHPHHSPFQQPATSSPLPPYYPHFNYGYTSHQNGGYNVIMTDDLVSGTRHEGKMSPVRRFFILLCTFDILFISLLWIISILVTGRDLAGELEQQVLRYTISASMFDCVVVAAARFIVCLLFYGLLDLSHWWPITLTTTLTVAFLIAKVFQYMWHNNPLTYDVMLVLLSFIISWGEVWFFDFRLIPLETRAKEVWSGHARHPPSNPQDERTPLLGGGGPASMLQRYIEGSTLYEGSVGNFYSPFESPEHSEYGEDDISDDSGIKIPRRFRRGKDQPLSSQESEFKKAGEDILGSAWRTLNLPDWKLLKKLENGDMIQVKQVKGKKLFKLTGYVGISPRRLLEDLVYGLENLPTWNPTVTECRIVQPIDEHTDVSYQVAAEAGGGVVSPRDFVNLRHWSLMEGGVFVSAFGSVTHPAMPPQPKRVRGENGAGCYALRPCDSDPQTCLFQWLLDVDLKGWIPQSVIDASLCSAQLEYLTHLRRRVVELQRDNLDTSLGSCTDILGSDIH